MEGIFDLTNVAFSCVYAIAVACMYLIGSLPLMGALQQCGYKKKRFFKWYFRKDNMNRERYVLFSLLALFSAAFMGLCFSFVAEPLVSKILSVCAIFFFAVAFIVCGNKYALKVETAITPRLKRLAVVYVLLLAIFNYICITLLNVGAYFADDHLVSCMSYFPLAAYIPLIPFTLTFANDLCSVFENMNNSKLVKKAAEKLSASSLIKIGVTGSYGKTSVKNILSVILSEKYKVLSTPSSYNTPVGIAKCINDGDLSDKEVFIAEMGARNQGDISELCSLVSPEYGILTGVCPQHIETFGSVENVLKEKKKLLERSEYSVYPANVLDPEEREGIIVYGDKKLEISDVECTSSGTKFALTAEGIKYSFDTVLLSAHSAKNIALAVGTALLLGMDMQEIKNGIEKIEHVEHRLKPIESNGVTVIDDAYNANPVGAKDGVETLKLFGGRKFIVTPGIVELGVLEKTSNEEFGRELVGLDRVILVGDTLVGAVRDGYASGGGDAEKLTVVPTLERAKEILSEELKTGDAVLFLNDLPDVY